MANPWRRIPRNPSIQRRKKWTNPVIINTWMKDWTPNFCGFIGKKLFAMNELKMWSISPTKCLADKTQKFLLKITLFSQFNMFFHFLRLSLAIILWFKFSYFTNSYRKMNIKTKFDRFDYPSAAAIMCLKASNIFSAFDCCWI